MKHPNKTRVRYEPHKHRDQTHAGHTGVVIFYTTDCWHRVQWDDPNPDPTFFNLGTVFRPEELVAYSNTVNLIVDTEANREGVSQKQNRRGRSLRFWTSSSQ